MSKFNFNIKRFRIPYFANWAVINKPFTGAKHYLEGNAICYNNNSGTKYANHIEMAGFQCSNIISYGATASGRLRLMRHVIFPQLRLFPNNTHSSLDYNFKGISIEFDGKKIKETVDKFVFDGIVRIFSHYDNISIERRIFPARNCKACIEQLFFTNYSSSNVQIKVINRDTVKTTFSIFGHQSRKYRLFAQIDCDALPIDTNETANINIAYCGANIDEQFVVDFGQEYENRLNFIASVTNNLVIETPNTHINIMSYYAKIRSAESIFATKAGLMHSPGGGGYYSALWTNDQCEYVNPFFAYLGYDKGIEQSINCYNLYKKYITNEKALITSIVAEGDSVWHGAGDRGDSAMYAYGCSRFLLTVGNKDLASTYIDHIEKCLNYTISKINKSGVVASDSDELENRFESGKANLCTSCIAYDALISCSYIETELGKTEKSKYYNEIAMTLRKNIENYFGCSIEDYDTYMYCKEESRLRSWIAMPLVVGIFDRATATTNALLSTKLRVNEGLVTRSGERTFWDRSTLYSLRGMFNAGKQNEALELLETYTTSRLLGEHIPYAVEAFPEGNQAQLSAESGLYVRILIEGMLGYRPTGFGKFIIKPNLPDSWNNVSVANMFISGIPVTINVSRLDNTTAITIDKEISRTILSDDSIEVLISN